MSHPFRIAALTGSLLLLALSAAVAQTPQPSETATTPETARDDRSTGPEDAVDDRSTGPEDGSNDRSTTPEDAGNEPAPNPNEAPPAPGAVWSNTPAQKSASSDGCWARLYDGENFAGRNMTLTGPSEMANVQGALRSIEVGEKATVVIFDDQDFADESMRFMPGQHASNMRGPERTADFSSLRMTCAAPSSGGPGQ